MEHKVPRMDNNAELYQGAVAAQLRAERAASGLTIDDLTARTTLGRASVFRYLSGERDIKMSALFELANALGVSVGELIRRAEQRM